VNTGAPITRADMAGLTAVSIIWGTNTLFSKMLVDLVPPMFVLTLRFAVMLLVLLPFLKRPGRQFGAMMAVALLTGPVHFGAQFLGFHLAHDLSPMVIAMQLWIPISVALAAVLLKERIAPLRLAGMCVAFAGIVVLAIEPSVLQQLDAFALVAFASAAYAAASILVRRFGGVDPVQSQIWVAIVSLPVVGLASAVFETGQVDAAIRGGWPVWGAIVFAALISGVLANAWMWTILKRQQVSRTTPFLLLSPAVAIMLGVTFMSDPVTPQLALGIALALGGFAIVALADRFARQAPTAP
jgi:O-acetylserine/cysteine efflux transporter